MPIVKLTSDDINQLLCPEGTGSYKPRSQGARLPLQAAPLPVAIRFLLLL
jgi:hypothetical protein